MDSDDESDLEYEALINIIINRRPRIMRQRRNFLSYYDDVDFRCRFRLTKQAAWMVLELIRSKIQHKTNKNGAMSPEVMFLITLRFFATGCMQRTGGDSSGVSKSSSCRAIRRVCRQTALLRERFIKFPVEVEKQRQMQKDFYKIAKFPRVLAAIDCTHVKIQSPGGDDAELFRNRKGYFSINVQTLCDSKLNILDIVARWPGSSHDAHILRNSRIFSKFEGREFGNALVVADGGYPCNGWIMTPLLKVETQAEALYNESQIRTRNCIERKYGVWKRRFAILALGIRMQIREVESIIVATAVLHNICNINKDVTAPPVYGDINDIIDTVVDVPTVPASGRSDNVHRRHIIQNYFESL
ncbi:PREDICTED: putative nuclease HARBI1 [Rhagoletis zephyria]|uniref:putative nuclease HARBI1 n=1 Tax=Rhagoletis zephyria TaxID=28612 RepID=UPI0008116E86|nr:PREDICTED: putative nuclease HARBI1 [Rhagoletis zephyria]